MFQFITGCRLLWRCLFQVWSCFVAQKISCCGSWFLPAESLWVLSLSIKCECDWERVCVCVCAIYVLNLLLMSWYSWQEVRECSSFSASCWLRLAAHPLLLEPLGLLVVAVRARVLAGRQLMSTLHHFSPWDVWTRIHFFLPGFHSVTTRQWPPHPNPQSACFGPPWVSQPDQTDVTCERY